jgi:hypothetical protein
LGGAEGKDKSDGGMAVLALWMAIFACHEGGVRF